MAHAKTISDLRESGIIADYAIEVIEEAEYIKARTIHEARVAELRQAYVDRRWREQDETDLQNEIDKLTGGNV